MMAEEQRYPHYEWFREQFARLDPLPLIAFPPIGACASLYDARLFIGRDGERLTMHYYDGKPGQPRRCVCDA